jgi:hypothetical protein
MSINVLELDDDELAAAAALRALAQLGHDPPDDLSRPARMS